MKYLASLLAVTAIALIAPTTADAQKSRVKPISKDVVLGSPTQSAKGNVKAAKARVAQGRVALKGAKADLKSARREELRLRPERQRLRSDWERANLANRANPTPANQQALRAASDRYVPVKARHEAALTELNRARTMTERLSVFQTNALNSLTAATKAARVKPVTGARPRVNANAQSQSQPRGAAVAASPGIIYSALPRLAALNYVALPAETGARAQAAANPAVPAPLNRPGIANIPPPLASVYSLPPPPPGARQYDIVPPIPAGNYNLRGLVRQNRHVYDQPNATLVP